MRGLLLMLVGTLFVQNEIASRVEDMIQPKFVGLHIRSIMQGVSVRENSPAEIGDMFGGIGKHVIVPGPTPKIEELSSLLHVDEVLSANRGAGPWSQSACGRGFWSDKTRARRVVARKSIVSWHWTIAQFTIGPEFHIPSWGFAAVLPNRSESPIVVSGLISFPKAVEVFGENEGLSVGNQGLSGEIILPSGRTPECCRERGYDDGGKSGDRSIVLVNEIASTLNISLSRAKESGRVFFGGIAVAVCILLGYALVEGWREKSLRRNKLTCPRQIRPI